MNSSRNTAPSRDLLDEVELLDEPGDDKLRLHFNGPFEGKEVRWHATLFTPAGWAREFDEARPQQNIIEIDEGSEGKFLLKVCLRVERIDRPTLRKAVMMIRQYKRLARGRHVYG